jgi:DNA-directed RNA polymerase specialized sigma subunit
MAITLARLWKTKPLDLDTVLRRLRMREPQSRYEIYLASLNVLSGDERAKRQRLGPIFALRYQYGLKEEYVAEIFGISESTVSKRFKKACNLVANIIDAALEE